MTLMDYDDDDDELPAISMDYSSASTVSDAAESSRALATSGSEYCRSDSPGRLDCEEAAALIAAIADLVVVREPLAPSFLVLLEALHQQLPVAFRGFISSYLEAANAAGHSRSKAKALYQEIMSEIISIIACPSNKLSDTDVISASAWLMCACASMRVGVNAMQAMQYLLNEIATNEQIEEVCKCIQRCHKWDAASLVRVSDCARGGAAGEGAAGEGAGAARAADVLLRAAAAAALGCHVTDVAPASVEEVTAWVLRALATPPAPEHEQPPDAEHEQPPEAEHEQPPDAEHEQPPDAEHEQPLAAEHEQLPDAEHEQPLAAEHEQPPDAEHEQPPDAEHEQPLAAEHEQLPDAEHEQPPDAEHEQPPDAEHEQPPDAEHEQPPAAEHPQQPEPSRSVVSDAAQLAAVQAAGRVLAHCTATDQQREALVAAFTRKSRARKPDAHKVALGVSRLKLIFRHNR